MMVVKIPRQIAVACRCLMVIFLRESLILTRFSARSPSWILPATYRYMAAHAPVGDVPLTLPPVVLRPDEVRAVLERMD